MGIKYPIQLLAALIIFSILGCQSSDSKKGHHGGHYGKTEPIPKAPYDLMTNVRQYTFEGRRTGEGYFSQDGRYIVFQSERHEGNPFYQIYVKDLKSGKTRRVSPGKGRTTCGWIHPSNKKVMFSSTHRDPQALTKQKTALEQRKSGHKKRYSWDYDENYEIYETNLNGKRIRRLTRAKGYDAEGSYSPNGKWIAFASNRHAYEVPPNMDDEARFKKDQSYLMDIYIMRSNGKGVKRLTTHKGYDGGPFFSPDGQRIVWRRFSPDGHSAEVYTMNLDGSDQKRITNLKTMSWAPYYHPSGDYIIFTTNKHGYGNFELYMVDSEGKQQPVRVSFMSGFDGLPVFTPDGRRLTWTRKRPSGESQIYMANWNDALARRLLKLAPKAPEPKTLQAEINEGEIRAYVNYLASDQLKGRFTGSKEEKAYTQVLAHHFKSMALKPGGDRGTYFQEFDFISDLKLGNSNRLTLDGVKLKSARVKKDWVPLAGSQNGSSKPFAIAFAGYGVVAPKDGQNAGYDSYQGIDVKDKWVMIFRYIPEDISPEKRAYFNRYSRVPFKIASAKNKGAKGVIFVSGPSSGVKKELIALESSSISSQTSIPIISITDSLAEQMLSSSGKSLQALQKKLDKGKSIPGFDLKGIKMGAQIDIKPIKSKGRNVLALLKVPGARKTLIVGAHGDHLGEGKHEGSLMTSKDKSSVHYGADDNASGVAGVMELAHYFSEAKRKKKLRLKKNILFVIWSGEEVGTLGSQHFAKARSLGKRGLAPKYTEYVNMDMIGRLGKNLSIQGVGSSKGWMGLIEKMGPNWNQPVSFVDDPYLPTDAMPLYLAKVPVINFFTGAHKDYHTPRDTPDKINYAGIKTVLNMVKDVVTELSRSKTGLSYNKVVRQSPKGGRGFRIYLGTIPDYSQKKVKGVKLSGVISGGPAESAGLKGGDVIVEFATMKIENIYDYVHSLQSLRPGKQTQIIVMREGQRKKLDITPQSKE